MSLGKYIKAIRRRRGLSQWELSRLSGLTRSHLSRLELDDFENPSAGTFLSLARALKIHPNDLYQAAGYIEGNARFRRSLVRTPQEALAEIEQVPFKPVPLLDTINNRTSGLVKYRRQEPADESATSVIGLLARGFSLEPEIKEGDVIFVDRAQQPGPGNVVLCCQDEKVRLMRYGSQSGDNGHSPHDFHIYGVVVGINRKIK
jgi:transcriptional regulator with XRE-family HTH domain